MADQITFTAPKTRVKEHSAHAIVARFRTRATGDVTPTTVHYRLDCLSTATQIADWTSASTGTTVTITTTPTHNAIQDDCNDVERKQLTVSADRGLSTEFNETYVYEVENARGWSA